MGLKAGRLRHRIAILYNDSTQDPVTGEMLDNWVILPGCEAVPCAIEPLSVRELIAAQAMQSKVTTKITIRYRPNMNAAFIIYHYAKDVVYNVSGFFSDSKSGLEFCVAMCTNLGKPVDFFDEINLNKFLVVIGQ